MARSERLAFEKEIYDVLTADGAGLFLRWDSYSKKPLFLDSESNAAIIGSSGTGKTRSEMIPMLYSILKKGESACVIDTKGDMLQETYWFAKAQGYRDIVFDFRNMENSVGCNPFGFLYRLYKTGTDENKRIALELGAKIAWIFYKKEDGAINDPFWQNSARALFMAAVEIMFVYAQSEEEVNILSILQIIDDGVKRIAGKSVFDYICEENRAASFSFLLKNCRAAGNDTLRSILSCTYQPLGSYVWNPELIQMISSNEFRISSLDGEEKVVIYVVTPDETDSYADMTSVIVSLLMTHYITLAQKNHSGKLPRRINWILDEVGNISRIPTLPMMMSAGRSRGCRTFVSIQSYAQLTNIYGENDASTIRENADTIVAFRTNHMPTLEELSGKLGDREVDYGDMFVKERLVTPAQLAAMETRQALVMISGRTKFFSWLPDYTEIIDRESWRPPEIKKRERNTKFAILDLKSIADELSRKNSKSDLANLLFTDNPLFPRSGVNEIRSHHLPQKGIDGINKEFEQQPGTDAKNDEHQDD